MVRTVGTVEKVFFVCRVLAREHVIVLVHDIFDRGFVRKLVDYDRNDVRKGSGSSLNSQIENNKMQGK